MAALVKAERPCLGPVVVARVAPARAVRVLWWNLGSATAVAFVLFLLMFGVTMLQMRVAGRGLEE